MQSTAFVVTVLVALPHLYFLVLEMFLWTTPYGRRVFGLTPEFAQASRALAANQGLYNGFLAAGLIWGLTLGEVVGTRRPRRVGMMTPGRGRSGPSGHKGAGLTLICH